MLTQRISPRYFVAAIAFTAGCSSYSATINKVVYDAGDGSGGFPNSGGNASTGGSGAVDSGVTTGGKSQTTTTTVVGASGGAETGGASGVGGAITGGTNSITGGAAPVGGSSAANSVVATGGTTSTVPVVTGGAIGAGGTSWTGAGGTTSVGGTTVGIGGIVGTGGVAVSNSIAVGGSSLGAGGVSSIGGSGGAGIGGTTASGGSSSAGGLPNTGGAGTGGMMVLGGSSAGVGGLSSTGGAGTGGASSSPCASQPCLNGGTCEISGSSYQCKCVGGYFGTNCETAHFEWLGLNGGFVQGISADGKVAVGSMPAASGKGIPARWTKETGFVPLESKSDIINQGDAVATNADGTVIVGQAQMGSIGGAYRWNATDGVVRLGLDIGSVATGVNSGGTAIVGTMAGSESPPLTHVFRWTPTAGVVDVVKLGLTGSVAGVSADGTVIAGDYAPVAGDYGLMPFRWTQIGGISELTSTLEPGCCTTTAISRDGSTIVGNSGGQAYRYVSSVGFNYLSPGDLVHGYPTAVNGDGTVVVGYGGPKAWIWDTTNEMRMLEDILTGFGVDLTELSGAALFNRAISSDGKTLAGTGYRNGVVTSWIARL